MELPVHYPSLSWKKRKAVRNAYIALQEDKCLFCKEDLHGAPHEEVAAKEINWDLFPPNFLAYPIHLQHLHDTGMTEGAVHAYCNAIWWQYEGR